MAAAQHTVMFLNYTYLFLNDKGSADYRVVVQAHH